MAYADVAVGIDYIFVGENAVGDHEVAQQVFELAHGGFSTVSNAGRPPGKRHEVNQP
jgi:hypothetical protein